GLAEPHVGLAVGEVVRGHAQEVDAQLLRDVLRELGVRPPGGEDERVTVRAGCDGHQWVFPSVSAPRAGTWSDSAGAADARGAEAPAAPCCARCRWAWAPTPGAASSAAAAAAPSAAAVPGRRRATQPSMLRCCPAATPSAPAGTSRRMTEPAAVYAPSPTVTGATNMLSAPVRAWEPMTVRCLFTPS